ncbi:MAG: hydroxymethylglutaryl-CoA lyase [Myxococcales bacterium]|nr:hydroxymethylglutaryl-CoA lyase [Myxococcales bacterium]
MFESLPDRVSVYEVSPRDGLQNETAIVPTTKKKRLLDALAASGLARIEMTSFVSPRWVPQLADADDLCALVDQRDPSVVYSALCPNEKGLERAIAGGIREIGMFVSASETHNKKNVNKTIDETLAVFEPVCVGARAAGIAVRGYVSCLWGCPYEGAIDPRRGLAVAHRLVELGCYQVSLGDTIGVGTPKQTRDIVKLFLAEFRPEQVALHLHDTRGTALANVIVGLDCGVRDFDASVGGLGGCPYAPGAAGNLATEDLVFTLHGMGVRTGVDLERLWEAGKVAESIVGRPLPSKVHQAGVRSLRS